MSTLSTVSEAPAPLVPAPAAASGLPAASSSVREAGVVAAATAAQRHRSLFSAHMPALDGVRGLAILAVLLFHFGTPTSSKAPIDGALTWLFSYGALGVNLFFVLSGFLITGILYDARDDPGYFRNFYMRRALRIFPLYYAVLAIVFLVVPAIPALQQSAIAALRSHQAWAWLYAVNIYLAIHGGWVLSYIQHFWSLAIEEQFYLVWPLVVWLLAARRRLFLTFALAAAGASFGGRIAASLLGASPIVTTVLTPFQLDTLALGAFLAVYLRQPDAEAAARRVIVPMALVGVSLLVLQFGVRHFSAFGNAVGSLRSGAFNLLLAALLLQALRAPSSSRWSRFFRSGALTTLGKYSYGVYVYHHFFSNYFSSHGTESALAAVVGSHLTALAIQAVAGMAASLAIAWLSYEYFEKYFLQLKRFWSPDSKPRALASVSSAP